MPIISVIVPVYKVEKYLERCVRSIMNQSLTDIEIILVDDGSPDNCPQICDKLAASDTRIQVIHKANGGLSSARNAGIELASGTFLTFVDSDDWIENNIYRFALDLQQQYNADLVEFGFRKVYSENTNISCENSNKTTILSCSGIDLLSRMYQNNLGGSVLAWNKLYRRELFSSIRFEEGRIFEDTLIMPKIFYEAGRCVVTNYCGYCYFQDNEASITHETFSERTICSIYAHQQNRLFYKDNQLTEAKLWCDTTYAFALVNMLRKIKDNLGKENQYYSQLKKEYFSNLKCFLLNPYFNWKQKLLILKNCVQI